MNTYSPVVLIGLDAASPDLIEKWIADDTLPNLKKLRSRGSFAQIGSKYDVIKDLPWVTFYTGVNQGKHGAYHYLRWRPEKMAAGRIVKEDIPIIPFWHTFRSEDPKTIAIDIPHTFIPDKMNGVEINGWSTRDMLEPRNCYPPGLLKDAAKNIRMPGVSIEQAKLFTLNELIDLQKQLIKEIESKASLVRYLSEKEPWDLLMVVFSGSHLGGHKFWDWTNLNYKDESINQMEVKELLKQVYIACDQAVGKIIDQLPPNATCIVCSLHSMGDNQSRGVILPEILEKILAEDNAPSKAASPKTGVLSSLRDLIPADFRHEVKKRLPQTLQDRLSVFWRMGSMKGSKTPAFALPYDYNAYIQINLKGREKDGLITPGEEYEKLLRKISEGIASFRDADTDEPIVDKVLRREELKLEGGYLGTLPDLTIRWLLTPAANHRALYSKLYGTVPWPMPGRIPEGRSGEHRHLGFLIAAGDQFPQNTCINGIRIVDLAPTILDLLGLKKSPHMEGQSIIPIQ